MGTTKGRGKYLSPDDIWNHFIDYVKEEENDRVTEEVFVGKDGDKEVKRHYIVLTWEAFETYLAVNGIINDLRDYRYNKDGRYEEYTEIITRINNYIYSKNFKGAATNQLSPNLIAKQLGIKEATSIDLNANMNILSIDPLSDSK